MAMIYCPECGQEISDRSKKCVHCGKVLVEEETKEGEDKNKVIICTECGAILSETDEVCPKCGCPVELCDDVIEVKPQEVQVTNINEIDVPNKKSNKKGKKIVIGVIIALIICIFGSIGYKVYSEKKAEEARIEAQKKAEEEKIEAQKKAEQEYKNAYNTYVDNLETVQSLMVEGGIDAESLANLTARVWHNAISEESDIETDPYTKSYGYFVDDFNIALDNLFSDAKIKTQISNIQNNQTSVKEIMKKLQDVPEGLEKCYDTVSELHRAYSTLTNIAINPTGSYNTFSTNKESAVSDFISINDKLDTQIPQKK